MTPLRRVRNRLIVALIVCVGSVGMSWALPSEGAEPHQAPRNGYAAGKREMGELVSLVDGYRKAHGRLPNWKKTQRFVKQVTHAQGVYMGIEFDYNHDGYCAYNGRHRASVWYDSWLRKYSPSRSKLRKNPDGMCWHLHEISRRAGERQHVVDDLSEALEDYVIATNAFPATLDAPTLEALGFALPAGYQLNGYKVRPWNPSVDDALFCVQNVNEGGYSRAYVRASWTDETHTGLFEDWATESGSLDGDARGGGEGACPGSWPATP